jgi:hypothetical protein
MDQHCSCTFIARVTPQVQVFAGVNASNDAFWLSIGVEIQFALPLQIFNEFF